MKADGELRLFPRYARTTKQLARWQDRVYRTFHHSLAQQGLKLTHQRRAIVEFLIGSKDHVGLDEVYEALRKRKLGIGRATVFRTLKLLEQCGLASRVSSKDETGRYELKYDRPHHEHMICVECGSIIEYRSPEMEHYQDEAAKRQGFQPLWHRHEIFGCCRDCQGAKAQECQP